MKISYLGFNTNTNYNKINQTNEKPASGNCVRFYDNNDLKLLANYSKAFIGFKGKNLDEEKLNRFNIPNFHIIANNCVRGESLSSRKNRKFITPVHNCGIQNIIDLREKYASTSFEQMCSKAGINYYNIPVDSSSVDTREIIENLPTLFEVLDEGQTYIACAQGLHRTDIALALNYIFNPKEQETPPVMYGHFRDYGFKFEDIARRLNAVKSELTQDDIKRLGWDVEAFEDVFSERKAELRRFNSDLAQEELNQ